MPDGLLVPNILTPQSKVPDWNVVNDNWANPVFEFAQDVLQDDRAILLFYPDNPKLRASKDQAAEDFGFNCLYDWWEVNELLLTSYNNPDCTVSYQVYDTLHLGMLESWFELEFFFKTHVLGRVYILIVDLGLHWACWNRGLNLNFFFKT
jgi:hypothetical protein